MNRLMLKVLRDLWATRGRTAFMVVALAAGLTSLGGVLGMRAVVSREMNREYLETVPASATLDVGEDGLSDALLAELRARPEVAAAERRATRQVRWRHPGGSWGRGLLFVSEDLGDQRLALVRPEAEQGAGHELSASDVPSGVSQMPKGSASGGGSEGSKPQRSRRQKQAGATVPGPGEVLVERSAMAVLGASIGDRVELGLGGRVLPVTIAGVVHEPALAPAITEQAGYFYAGPDTWGALAPGEALDEVRVLVAEAPLDPVAVRTQVGQTAAWLTSRGLTLHEVRIPPPGQHPHQRPSEAILLLFSTFSGLTVALASVLSASLLAITLARQAREVAVTKALGATRAQTGLATASALLLIAAAACALAVLPSIGLARAGVDAVMGLLNLDVASYAVPGHLVLGLLLFGLALPLLTGLPVIARATRIPVLEAMNDHGARPQPDPRWLPRLGDRLTAAAVRNALRVPRRLLLAVTLLAVGGGLFVTARSVRDAWTATTERVLHDRHYDVEIVLAQPVGSLVDGLDPGWHVETWATAPVSLADPSGLPVSSTWPDGGHGSFTLVGVPDDQRLVRFPLLDGRWPAASGEVALNQVAAARVGPSPVGRTVEFVVEGRRATWTVVGVVEEVASPAAAYVGLEAFEERTGLLPQTLRLDTGSRSFAQTRATVARLERELDEDGVSVVRVAPIELLYNAMGEHVVVLVQSLTGLSLLMAAVGVLALAATTSANVAERTRELAVLRAVGARPHQVWRLVLVEGWLVTIVSLPLAILVAAPTSALVGRVVGRLAFELPLPLDLSWSAWAAWSVAVLLVSSAASLVPAVGATRGTVREALART
ncbi:MAG: ABC transporter permease [Alphaproteobacteria bacterium]|nr:ABC transporter permease [Alphaproteobacteria bacterium]